MRPAESGTQSVGFAALRPPLVGMSGNQSPGASASVDDLICIRGVHAQAAPNLVQLGGPPSSATAHSMPERDRIQAEQGDQISLGHDIGTPHARCDGLSKPLREQGGIDNARSETSRPATTGGGRAARPLLDERLDVIRCVERGPTAEGDRSREGGIADAELVHAADGHIKAFRHLSAVEELAVHHDHEYNERGDHSGMKRHAATSTLPGTRFRNLVLMKDHLNAEEIRRGLRAVAVELAKKDELIDRRGELIARARAQDPPMTTREIAQLLGMTERGVTKALDAYRQRHAPLAS